MSWEKLLIISWLGIGMCMTPTVAAIGKVAEPANNDQAIIENLEILEAMELLDDYEILQEFEMISEDSPENWLNKEVD